MKFTMKFIRSLGLLFIFSIAVLCIFTSLFIKELDSNSWLNNFIQYTIGLENRFYDYRLRNHLDPKWQSKEIALVDIDDESLHKIGTWPIPREYHAKLIDKLRVYGAKVIALDILYPESAPETNGKSPDDLLIDSFKKFQEDEGKRIFLAWTTAHDEQSRLAEPPIEMFNDMIDSFIPPDVMLHQQTINKYNFPHEKFWESGVGFGSISMVEDYDGFFREYLLVLNVDTTFFGSLGFNAYQAYTGKKNRIRYDKFGYGTISLEDGNSAQISNMGELKIRFLGHADQFSRVSLWDVLNQPSTDQKLIEAFQNKIVYVGSTALGAHDLRASPIDNKMPGVLAHMNITQMFLDNYFLKPSNESIKFSILILCLGMLIFLGVQTLNIALLDLVTICAIIYLSYYVDSQYFFKEGYELKLFYCYFCFIASYSWNTFLKFAEANREKKQIRGTFSRYVAPTVVDEMLKEPDKLQVGGHKKDITCLFSDIRDFTSISEQLTAAEIASSLNLYMSEMTDIIFDTKGTLDKYIGDAIVAFWGAPLEIGNHAEYAVNAAIKMIETLPAVNEKLTKQNRPVFDIGIGLNSGECSVGNMGSSRIFSYTALGDNMNLGARLEGLCKHYGAKILISEETLNRIDKSKFLTRPIDNVIVKGKTKAVSIHEVLTREHALYKDPNLYESYIKGFKHFQNKSFKEAKTELDKVLRVIPLDLPTQRVSNLTALYIENPETANEDFNITKMKEK